MHTRSIDGIVVGAGQAGLGTSYFLQQNGIEHLVLEKGEIGETWLSQRWDSFQLNTPNDMNTLPGAAYEGYEPDGFWTAPELVRYFNDYVETFKLPVKTHVSVTSIRRDDDLRHFIVETIDHAQHQEIYRCRVVVIASGIQNSPRIPALHSQIADEIVQLHSAEYKNSASLPPGAVVVVGSAQTGIQITEDLMKAGREVYLCTSKVGRIPRRYRGKDIAHWMREIKFLDVTYESLEDPSVAEARQPQVSGVGRYGHTVSLQSLAKRGVKILGRLERVEGNKLHLGNQAKENLLFGDQVSQNIKELIDQFIVESGMDLPPLEPDPADEPDPLGASISDIPTLDLGEIGAAAVIWATGFGGDLDWLHVPDAFRNGAPLHTSGRSPAPGLFFIGHPWLHSRGSGILYGIRKDARNITNAVCEFLNSSQTSVES